jgi:hypothetical protein
MQKELDEIYTLHWKKAKAVFIDEPVILEQLGTKGILPQPF